MKFKMNLTFSSYLACICTIVILTSSLGTCDPIPETIPPNDISYDLEKISLLAAEQKEFDLEKTPYKKESYELADLQKALNDEHFREYFEEVLEKQQKQDVATSLQENHDKQPLHVYTADTSPTEDAQTMQADAFSTITRYVGVGYNLLRGNPEGDYNRGGPDPGILTTRPIFEQSYGRGKQEYYRGDTYNEPDQVDFHAKSGCSGADEYTAYSGEESYQKHLAVNVDAEASYVGFEFGLSSGMEHARAGTEKQERVDVVQEEICTVGTVRYLLENRNDAAFKVTTSFYNAIKWITARGWSPWCYFPFLDDWGTHIIVEADVGSRTIFRSYLSYIETYKELKKKTNTGVSAGGEYKGFTGSLSVDIATVNDKIDSNFHRIERVERIEIGKAEPMPIHMKLKPITDALSPEYWRDLPNGDTYESLRVAEKRVQFERALREYPGYLHIKPLTDAKILIPNAWPDGTYALQSTPSGCPSGWSEGWRKHDTEDTNSNNEWSQNLPTRVRGSYMKNDVTQYYCVKGEYATNHGLEWPKGSYCIARKGGECPTKFHEGYIHWDDEDSNTQNEQFGVLPDGEYGDNTRIQYCCRNDERPNIDIILPIDQPFVLYRYGGTCQSVAGMSVASEYLKFDDQDTGNDDSCSGAHPDDDGCNNNHKIHYCYYY